jgi:ABC-type transport system substrate-binding protein
MGGSWRRGLATAFTILVSGAVLAACGGSSGGSSPTTSASASSGNSSTVKAPSEVTVALGAKPLKLDGDLAEFTSDLGVIHLIGGNLFELRGSGAVSPGLAQSYKVTNNGLTGTAVLRPNLKFSDGSPLTAADVVASFNRSMHDKANAYAGFFAPVKSVVAKGADTVVLTFTRPYPSFTTIAAEPQWVIYPAKDLNPKDGTVKGNFFTHPISDGPYKLAGSWDGQPDVTMVRNPDYWGPKAAVQTVKFATIPDPNARINELRSGQVQVIESIPPNLISSVKADGLNVMSQLSYGAISLIANGKNSKLANANVRHAMSLALNRKELAQVVFDGTVPPLVGFWPNNYSGYVADDQNAAAITSNDAEAKKLLANSPCANGACTFTIQFAPDASPYAPQMAPLVQSELQAIGIHASLVSEDSATNYANVSAGKFSLDIGGIYDFANVPDGLPVYMLQVAGGLNSDFTSYNSPQMNALVTTAEESTGSKRITAEHEIDALYLRDIPFINVVPFADVWATKLSPKLVFFDHGLFIQVEREGS